MRSSFYGKLALLVFLSLVQWVCCDDGATTLGHPRKVRFDLTLTWEDREVAGAVRKTIVSNGQFPAPILRLHQGDQVEFAVHNWLPFSTTVHFHGTPHLSPEDIYVMRLASRL